jgi:hypothetical protein
MKLLMNYESCTYTYTFTINKHINNFSTLHLEKTGHFAGITYNFSFFIELSYAQYVPIDQFSIIDGRDISILSVDAPKQQNVGGHMFRITRPGYDRLTVRRHEEKRKETRITMSDKPRRKETRRNCK